MMKELKGVLNLDAKGVSGKSVGEIITGLKRVNEEVIRPVDRAYSDRGGLCILFGNLATEGAVVKRSAVAPDMMVHKGPARVFDSEEAVTTALMKGDIKSGDVIVIRDFLA